ncbi:nuclear transport factor 2 family protein [Lentzea roselyniae]|uniref:Nuclear transport factor 2 family protein n=1 Tax=Lentzea roselyniae TaxID=531940 RepID=A0ABP7C5Z2_9PSEU
MNNETLVLQAIRELYDDRDPSAVDRWFALGYRQHSAWAADGPDALRGLVLNLSDSFRYDLARVIVDGEFVAVHGTYHGLALAPLVGFNLFRVEEGKIVEHWDAHTPEAGPTASGWSQTDGPDEPNPFADTELSRAIVTEYAEHVLVKADYSLLSDYVSESVFFQHNPWIEDGLTAFGRAVHQWHEQGVRYGYDMVHRVVAEGDFALVQSSGTFGAPVAFWDLFRVADNRIVEHWDVIAPIPDELPHDNGVF